VVSIQRMIIISLEIGHSNHVSCACSVSKIPPLVWLSCVRDCLWPYFNSRVAAKIISRVDSYHTLVAHDSAARIVDLSPPVHQQSYICHISGPGDAIGLLCVCVRVRTTTNEMTSDWLVSWSSTSLFSTNMAISETKMTSDTDQVIHGGSCPVYVTFAGQSHTSKRTVEVTVPC